MPVIGDESCYDSTMAVFAIWRRRMSSLLYSLEVFLCMRPGLGTRAGADVLLDRLPVLAVELKSDEEAFVFFL